MKMSNFAKKLVGHRTLRKRLKSKDKTIQRLRNRVAWLELQLTLHFAEDRTAEVDHEEIVVEDDCTKCEQLRNMLDASLKIPLLPGLHALQENPSDVLNETSVVFSDTETAGSDNQQDVKLTINPSHHSVSSDQQGDAQKLTQGDQGVFSGDLSGNVCCVFIVVVAMLLVHWS